MTGAGVVKRVFLSSPQNGMRAERAAASDAVRRMKNFQLVCMEDFGALPSAPQDACRSILETCDVVVLALGTEYGSIVPGESRSFTHLEYETATSLRKPILVFMARETGPLQDNAALSAFRAVLARERVVDYFADPSELAARAATALHNFDKSGRAHVPFPPQPLIVHPYPADARFVGRGELRTELTAWYDAGPQSLLVVDALGGGGKSALAWHWSQFDILGAPRIAHAPLPDRRHAPQQSPEGLFWWSFYEVDAGFQRFLRSFLTYARGPDPEPSSSDNRVLEATQILRNERLLLVLDGFERELRSYERSEFTARNEPPRGGDRLERRCIDKAASHFLRSVAGAAMRSRVLITTRLMPSDLEDDSQRTLPNCKRLTISGLSRGEILTLAEVSGIPPKEHRPFADRAELHLNHPLLVRVLLGVILADPILQISALQGYDPIPDLRARQHHILSVAFESLDATDARLLCKLAATRGPFSHALAYASDGAGEPKARAQTEIRRALNDLLKRALIQWEDRRQLFDIHPIVRDYAYARLTNKESVHEALGNFLQTYALRSGLSSRADFQAVVELYHHQLGAKLYHAAFALLRDRLFVPLVNQFHDFPTALQVFLSYASDEQPIPWTADYRDNALWFNRQVAFLLRLSGRFPEALDWLAKLGAAFKDDAMVSMDLATLADGDAEVALERIRLSRRSGRLTEARRIGARSLRDLSSFGMEGSSTCISLLAELAVVDAYRGNSELGARTLDDAFSLLEKVEADRPEYHLHAACAHRCRAQIALVACDWLSVLDALSKAERALEASGISAAVRLEEELLCTQLRALAAAELAHGGRDAKRLSDPNDKVLPGISVQGLQDVWTRVEDALSQARRVGLLELEVDLLLAEAALEWALGNEEGASATLSDGLQLAQYAGASLALIDAVVLALRIAVARNDVEGMRLRMAELISRSAELDSPYVVMERARERFEPNIWPE